jgi:hypothetical protein
MNKKWLTIEENYKLVSSNVAIIDNLPKGIYSLEQNEFSKEFSLTKLQDEFVFNFKLYDVEDKFINKVVHTYNNTKSNLGVLLNGYKGTGKSISAKIIANKLNLPVIIISNCFEGLIDWITELKFDVILFFDEFEKNFEYDKSSVLLSIMDGVYNTEHRKIFLLTSNNIHFDSNFLSRPSRIRYRKEFRNLSHHTIEEYLNDNLKDKSYYDDICKFVNTLEISTIDILKCIVEECNLQPGESLQAIVKDLNIQTANYTYSCIRVSKDYEHGKTFDEYRKRLLESKYENDWNVDSTTIRCNQPIQLYKPGDILSGHEMVTKAIDAEGFIYTRDRGFEYMYKINMQSASEPALYYLV